MRVVFTSTFGARMGGAESMLMTFLRHVDRARIDPCVVFFEDGPWPEEVRALGIEALVMPTGRFREPRRGCAATVRLARELRRRRPALIVNWFTRAQLYGAPAAALAGLASRVVWWQHGVVGDDRWLDRAATALPARAIGTSSRANAAAQRRLRPRRRTFAVHPGVEAPAVSAGAPLEIPDGAFVVGTVGRLQPWKAQHLLVEAIAAADARAHALIVGGDAHDLAPGYGPWLRRRAAELGVADRMTFVGHTGAVGRYLGAMDAFVSTSPAEPFGIALVEAMALGKPVAAVDAPGPREIVEPERSGLIVEPAGLAGAIDRLVADADLRVRLAAGARQRYATAFTPERMCSELTARLEELACV